MISRGFPVLQCDAVYGGRPFDETNPIPPICGERGTTDVGGTEDSQVAFAVRGCGIWEEMRGDDRAKSQRSFFRSCKYLGGHRLRGQVHFGRRLETALLARIVSRLIDGRLLRFQQSGAKFNVSGLAILRSHRNFLPDSRVARVS